MGETAGPTLLGVDVLWVATLLSGVAAFAVMLAIYAATTVRDPMAKRVKALNDRREQLKAGITASTKRRAKLVQRNDTADKMRGLLSSMKVLQESQVKAAQVKLMQAGIRSKDWAVAVIFGRLVLPIVIELTKLIRRRRAPATSIVDAPRVVAPDRASSTIGS